MNEIKINKNSTSKLLVILVMVVIVILSATVFRQLVSNTLQVLKENKTKQEKLGVLTKKLQYLRDLDPNQLEKRAKDLEQIFPSRKPALETINALNLLAVEDGVFLGSITLNPGKLEGAESPEESSKGVSPEATSSAAQVATSSSTSQNFKLTFSVTGEMEKVSDFIKDLQEIAPLNKIKELGISIKKDTKGVLLVDLGIEVYFQPLPKTLSPVDTPLVSLTPEEEQTLDSLGSFKFYPLTSLPDVTTGKENIFKKTL